MAVKYFCDKCGREITSKTKLSPGDPIIARYDNGLRKGKVSAEISLAVSIANEEDMLCKWCALQFITDICGKPLPLSGISIKIKEKKEPINVTTIDRKFIFKAINPCNENTYTQDDALILCAKDAAVLPAMRAYYDACVALECDKHHLESVELLIARIRRYQVEIESRVPDTDSSCEISRCIVGELN